MSRGSFGRRAVVAGLVGAAAAPFRVWAQVPLSPPPQIATPAPPQVTPPGTPPAVSPPRPVTPASAIDKDKLYYVFFDQQIDTATMLALRRQLTALVEAGVSQITLIIDSTGGMIDPTLVTYSFIRSLPVQFDTHAVGFVQSASTVLFLAGDRRSADRSARFLFHPSTTTLIGALNEQQLSERLTMVDSVQTVLGGIYRDRTRLTADQVGRFAKSEVILTADEPLASGVVDEVADLKIPGGNTARILFMG